jgi:phosphoribosylaminoimidazole (AIR) synthetase
MAVVLPAAQARHAIEVLAAHGEQAWLAGRIEAGERKVVLA